MEEVETACLFEYDLRFQRMLASEDCYLLSKHNKKQNNQNFKLFQGGTSDKELELNVPNCSLKG